MHLCDQRVERGEFAFVAQLRDELDFEALPYRSPSKSNRCASSSGSSAVDRRARAEARDARIGSREPPRAPRTAKTPVQRRRLRDAGAGSRSDSRACGRAARPATTRPLIAYGRPSSCAARVKFAGRQRRAHARGTDALAPSCTGAAHLDLEAAPRPAARSTRRSPRRVREAEVVADHHARAPRRARSTRSNSRLRLAANRASKRSTITRSTPARRAAASFSRSRVRRAGARARRRTRAAWARRSAPPKARQPFAVLAQPLDQRLVPAMHAVEITDGDARTRAAPPSQVMQSANEFHRRYHPRRAECGVAGSAGRVASAAK